MRFFEHQREARKQSQRLSAVFSLIVLAELLIANAFLALPFVVLPWLLGIYAPLGYFLPLYFFETVTFVVLLFILGGWWIELSRLRQGGVALAERIGAQRAQRLQNNRGNAQAQTREIQFSNIVEELALAARMRAPQAYVLPREMGINAFAAGWGERDSVVCITQGALDGLNRDEISGLVAHELSHIYEGDTRLNMRLAGMVLGLELVHNMGQDMMESGNALGLMLGPSVRLTGWLGWVAARAMKAAISREREFLADARAIQFTRSKEGLGGALRKVAWQQQQHGAGEAKVLHPAVQHMLLVGDELTQSRRLQTHPPIQERIRRIYGRSMPTLEVLADGEGEWQNPFAHSQPLPPPHEESYRAR